MDYLFDTRIHTIQDAIYTVYRESAVNILSGYLIGVNGEALGKGTSQARA